MSQTSQEVINQGVDNDETASINGLAHQETPLVGRGLIQVTQPGITSQRDLPTDPSRH